MALVAFNFGGNMYIRRLHERALLIHNWFTIESLVIDQGLVTDSWWT